MEHKKLFFPLFCLLFFCSQETVCMKRKKKYKYRFLPKMKPSEREKPISGKTFQLLVGPQCEKTKRLIESISRREKEPGGLAQAFNYKKDSLQSPCGEWHDAEPVASAQEIKEFLNEYKSVNFIAIDEAQKFDDDLAPLIEQLDKTEVQVVAAMLKGKNSGLKRKLSRIAHVVEILIERCKKCNETLSLIRYDKSGNLMEEQKSIEEMMRLETYQKLLRKKAEPYKK